MLVEGGKGKVGREIFSSYFLLFTSYSLLKIGINGETTHQIQSAAGIFAQAHR